MSTDELTDVLERWCDAVAAAELAPEGSPERDAAELRVRRLDLGVNAALDGVWRARLDTIAQHVDHDRS